MVQSCCLDGHFHHLMDLQGTELLYNNFYWI
jgi:hypothetical protein